MVCMLRIARRPRVWTRPQWLRASTQRFSSSAYDGEMTDAMRFECVNPPATTLEPKQLRGRPVLVVNTASQCQYAPQLKDLQTLYDKYHAQGLEIIAVPSNDFDRKEPASDEELTMVYSKAETFQVAFPIAKKTGVIGEDAHAFFARIAQIYGRSVAPTWNFDKFLVDAYGDLAAVFPHDTEPLVPQVIEAIEDAIADMPTPGDEEEDDED
ncbi:hypothetical protein Poli38472_010808 [Pythium oligandrum]|uniref:Glutathione peroxidase n=1 Tax=Pythium oligandrum TaxID=41045 RepID=A0A8K1CFA8_PYTOL|nr:hypothetical protein Poli38472_010808 [Pythium oligandrum]|eukprot:TMW61745.1 hypothetical protein Poli38472_010808 [Pythium oligandrum]